MLASISDHRQLPNFRSLDTEQQVQWWVMEDNVGLRNAGEKEIFIVERHSPLRAFLKRMLQKLIGGASCNLLGPKVC